MDHPGLPDPGLELGVKFLPEDPPRRFAVDQPAAVPTPLFLSDCGDLELDPDEQVTFATESGAEYDVARKSWGYYATPSLNGRLVKFGLRAVLVRDEARKYVVLLVERGHESDFQKYLDLEGYVIVCWMDSTEALQALEATLAR